MLYKQTNKHVSQLVGSKDPMIKAAAKQKVFIRISGLNIKNCNSSPPHEEAFPREIAENIDSEIPKTTQFSDH